MKKKLISINNCRIENSKETLLQNINWSYESGQAWLVIGPNGGGKAEFLNALANEAGIRFVGNEKNEGDRPLNQSTWKAGDRPLNQSKSSYFSSFEKSVEIVSLEKAAKIIEEERINDESDYVEGGIDHGRSGRIFISQSLDNSIKKNSSLPEFAKNLEKDPSIKLCGIEKILDRGLKYMSTGEIRRTLLARALISGKKLLILSDPFAGLDKESRTILLEFFYSITERQIKKPENNSFPHIILAMERWNEIPENISHVIEFSNKEISFCGCKEDYLKKLNQSDKNHLTEKKELKDSFYEIIQTTSKGENSEGTVLSQSSTSEGTVLSKSSTSEGTVLSKSSTSEGTVLSKSSTSTEGTVLSQSEGTDLSASSKILVEMKNVNVGWGDNRVLKNINWKLLEGNHWLIRGPNGSGKTTFLELITGDNQQVYSNEIYMFGKKRGSGESIWDIKKNLGIVSYRMHVEYRMLGGTSLQNVIISGLRDSIGLYGKASDLEISTAKKWLALAKLQERADENFGNLSYGEQRAVLILRAVVKSPKILILDEPCHGLDENYRFKILELLELIAEQKTTTLLHVTHDPSEMLKCEKHILELHPESEPMYKIIEL